MDYGFTSCFMGKEEGIKRVRVCGEGFSQSDILRPKSSFLHAPEVLQGLLIYPVSAHGPAGCSWLLGTPFPLL